VSNFEASKDDKHSEGDKPAIAQSQQKSQRTRKGKAPVHESMAMDEDEEE
jgi:hypothetical protein